VPRRHRLLPHLDTGDVVARRRPPLLLGAVLAVPFAALTVRRLPQRSFTLAVAVAVVLLGSWSLFQALR